jgi:hypothetical protein
MEALVAVLAKILEVVMSIAPRYKTVATGSTKTPYLEQTYTIAAGQTVSVGFVHDYFRVISLTGGTLAFRQGQNANVSLFTGQGLGFKSDDLFDTIQLYNRHATDSMTITIALAIGTVHDDRLSVSSTITTADNKVEDTAAASGDTGSFALTVRNDSMGTTPAGTNGDYQQISSDEKGAIFVKPVNKTINTSQTSVSTSAVQLVTAAALNGEIIISAGSIDLYIGNSSGVTTANGFLISANSSLGLNGNVGDIYGIRSAGTTNAFVLLGKN